MSLDPKFEILTLERKNFDLRDNDLMAKFLRKNTPDLVVHAAAKVGGIQANISSPVEFLASNIQMDTNVITSCIENGVKNLIYVGSSCMYPKDYRQPLSESDLLKGPLEPTNEGYALAKITGSKLCEYASRSLGVNYKTIIPSNLYGPGDNFSELYSHLVASVIRKVHRAKLEGTKTVQVWGSGVARREFTFVDDLASWVSSIAGGVEQLPSYLNVGIGSDLSINEYYQVASEVIGANIQIENDLSKPEGMMAKLLDSSLARRECGWNPQTDIFQGIKKTYEWYLKNEGIKS
jgi:GDP-L-fucose synthase